MTAAGIGPAASAVAGQAVPAGSDGRHTCGGGIQVWLEAPGVMRVKLPKFADVTGRHAAAAAEVVRTLAGGHRYPLLLDLTQVKSVSRKARSVYGHPKTVTAYALLGDGPVDRVLAHYFLGSSPEGLPAKFFESESDALRWLGAACDER